MKIAIIGGGAAGLFAGARLREGNVDVTIFDGNEKLGKKLYITGKGRCNLTNNCDRDEFLSNIVRGEKFMMSSLSAFLPQDTMDFFEERGLRLKTERGNRVFPASDKSSDVIKTLERSCRGCEIKLNEKVKDISFSSEVFKVVTEKGKYIFDKVIIATGGKSYSATGSCGSGYKFARTFGHEVVEARAALVPIRLADNVLGLEGLALKNVTLHAEADGKKLSQFGEMLFTGDGITGPIVLSMSSLINRAGKISLWLDFKPALSEVQLDGRLLREFENAKNKNLSNVMHTLLPKNLVPFFLQKAGLNGEVKVNSVTASMRRTLLGYLKHFPLAYKSLYPIEAGIITSGGVNLSEVNPKTMESKKQVGLYFIGEVLDVDALTGGFNLQIAFATANACAKAIIKEV